MFDRLRALLTAQGRLNRKAFLYRLVITLCINLILITLLSSIENYALPIHCNNILEQLLIGSYIPLAALSVWAILACVVRRLRDINFSSLWIIALAIWPAIMDILERASQGMPFNGAVYSLLKIIPYLLLSSIPGSDVNNRYSSSIRKF